MTTLVGDLERAVDELRTAFGVSVSRLDDGTTAKAHGIRNAWIPFGTSFVEVATPASSDGSAARLHNRFGDGGYMVILQIDDLDAARAQLKDAAVEVSWEIDLPGAVELHLDHGGLGGTLVAIDWAEQAGDWRWAGPDWRTHVRSDVIGEITAAEIAVPSPARTADRWSTMLDRPAHAAGDGTYAIALDEGVLRFVESDAHGRGRLVAAEVSAASAEHIGKVVHAAGIELRVVAA